MARRTKLDTTSIDPALARSILNNLHRSCVAAARDLGDEMGFSINIVNFSIDPFPKEVIEIDFVFNIKITAG